MLVSPLTFYRGAARIMANDLASTPDSGLTVQCCGDAHLSNFGAFASPERRLVFDINDFDETLPGPWEWDVKRLAASMLVASMDNGFHVKDHDRIVLDTVRSYRSAMRESAGCLAPTATPLSLIGACSSRSSSFTTWRSRWSASEASARAAGSP
jgi:uncharacterized protein (DUF2252 family)